MNNIKVDIHVTCYNEIFLCPFVLDYWKLLANHVYVYLMKSSNDGSKEFFEKYPDFISIIEIEDNNEKSEKLLMDIRNNKWKQSMGNADFVIVCDFDECIYSPNIFEELQYMKDNNMTICFPEIYDLVSIDDVKYNGKLLHKFIGGNKCPEFGKKILFDPNKIKEMNFGCGSHTCNPIGDVKYYDKHNIYLFHAHNLGLERTLNRNNIQKNRISQYNKEHSYSVHYQTSR